MATQWYIRRGSKISSPRDSAQLKSDATTGFVKPTDEVSQSPSGPWTVAQKVKGLFPEEEASDIFQFYADEPAAQVNSSLKPCPFCAEKIQAEAIKCKHCGEFLNKPPSDRNIVDPSKRPQSGSPNLSELDKQRIMEEEAFKIKARDTHRNASPLRKGLRIITLILFIFMVVGFVTAYRSNNREAAEAFGSGVALIGLLLGLTFINRVA